MQPQHGLFQTEFYEYHPVTHPRTHTRLRHGIVVSGVCRINEVNARRAGLVLG